MLKTGLCFAILFVLALSPTILGKSYNDAAVGYMPYYALMPVPLALTGGMYGWGMPGMGLGLGGLGNYYGLYGSRLGYFGYPALGLGGYNYS